MQNFLYGVAEYLTPVLKNSLFLENGVLTPEEFVAAGDLLVHTCPTWQWQSGDPNLARPFLPAGKQFLLTRNVPCMQRVGALEEGYSGEIEVECGDEGEDGWLETHTAKTEDTGDIIGDDIGTIGSSGVIESSARLVENYGDDIDDIGDILGEAKAAPSIMGGVVIREDHISDEYADMASFEDENLVADDSAILMTAEEPSDNDNIIRTRRYDLSITYDKYYQTPRLWLFGYDESGQPLSQEAVFEDIMQDYANRTVTMEVHPHIPGVSHASIHPCRHAAVMKKITDHIVDGGNAPRVDQYLFFFLKFIQSVVPTINYDYTLAMDVGAGRESKAE